jgi:hypothetical protein
MNLLLFWIRIAARRFVSLFKTSPVIIAGTIIIIAAFIIARNDIEIILNVQRFILAISFFILVSVLLSFKNFSLMSQQIIYSKSALKNRTIRILFFTRQAFFNNILLILFDIVALKGIVESDYLIMLPAVTLCSLLLSVLIMFLKNEVKMRRIKKKQAKASKINPLIKGIIFDYFSSDFLLTALISIVLLIIIFAEFISKGFLLNTEDPSILFIGMLIVLSLGFMGIIESVPRINWKFHGIVSPRGYDYHVKRTVIFLGVFFILPVLFFIFMLASSGAIFLLKYLYCLAVLLFCSIFISFTISRSIYRIIYKAVILIAVIVFTAWVSFLRIAFLPVLLVPALAFFIKSKNEYREWYYQ